MCGFPMRLEVAETRCFQERCHINAVESTIWQEKNHCDSDWPEEQVAFLTFKKKCFKPTLRRSRYCLRLIFFFFLNSPVGCILEWGCQAVGPGLLESSSLVERGSLPGPWQERRSARTPHPGPRPTSRPEGCEPAGWDRLALACLDGTPWPLPQAKEGPARFSPACCA